jgi:aminopeptidase N
VASYAAENKVATKRLIGLAFDAIKFYDYLLGPFPFEEFNIIEVPQFGWGQAPPATMFITHELFDRVDPGYGFSEAEVNARFAHEIAHQYWGQVVKMPSLEEQWLTESFADYSAALFIQQAYGKQGKAQFDRIRSTWKGNAMQARNDSSIALSNRLATPFEPFLGYDHRRWLLYDKGPLLLDALRKELGDDQFLTFLHSYQKSFAWKFGTTRDVAGLLSYMTKKDYAPFFDKYYWGTEAPK